MTWALRRQIFYIAVLIAFFSILGFLVVYPQLDRTPKCTDGRQNGDERGVDCGGSCRNACMNEVEDLSVLWSRSFRVVPGRYNAVAYLTNHNKNAVVNKINYRFRFADKDNIYIGKRGGSTFIPRAGNFAVFEGGVGLGESVPVYTTFEFTEAPEWIQAGEEKINQLKVIVSDIVLENEMTNPRLSARVKNSSLFSIPDITVVAILYDSFHNAVSISSTYLDKLSPEQQRDISFTWPEPFSAPVVAKEVIPMYNISRVEWK
ncbi:hypothetical protein A3C67_01055 [Candidatus Nomurabacteria bacterium RIFCSPHIGHO2_02_FULL_42_19]|uniref:Glucose/sorbosone dehydrogenase n=1 Tax=Candidatus Nomurabacteria bacterium RIFCSPHIGHO2_02_FULL_42_19 TaxID=1801756 RepID=A0A1F6W0P3_9BACT|nr:MAG: hypothetical protein A3C67_01055 [Candidatus Nomurabacteria bacterium RIFCSPHIGHO2_02_FULL_42_19]